jgi:hypothetical protein
MENPYVHSDDAKIVSTHYKSPKYLQPLVSNNPQVKEDGKERLPAANVNIRDFLNLEVFKKEMNNMVE